MIIPLIHYVNRKEFDEAEGVYKIISDSNTNTHVYFELKNKKYYIGYSSSDIIKVDLIILAKEEYLLIGVDLKVVVLSISNGSVLFSIGLFSYFKGFKDNNEITFTIFSELEDIIVNKNGLSISQIVSHDLDF
ncbi:hypothetical protein ACX0G9_30825 [Flavitalea flava]